MSMTISIKKWYFQLTIPVILIVLMICACIKRQVINEKEDLQRIDTLACRKSLEITSPPNFNNPTIELKSKKAGSGKALYKKTISYKNKPTLMGWGSMLIPSLAAGFWGYSKMSTGSVVMGRDMIGLCVLPPLITYGFSQIVFKKHESFDKPFAFNIPNTLDQIRTQINNKDYIKPTIPDNNGTISINLYELLDKFPHSDLTVFFSCSDKSINPCKTTISVDLMNKLSIQRLCAEIDTVCFVIDGFQHGLVLIMGSFLEGYNTLKGRGLIQDGIESYRETKTVYDGMRKTAIFNQTYRELDLVVPKMSNFFNIYVEYLNYGKVVSSSSRQIEEIQREVVVGEDKHAAKNIIVRRLEKPLKYDLAEISLSDILIDDIWFTMLPGHYSRPFLNSPARRDSIVQKVFNELSNQQ